MIANRGRIGQLASLLVVVGSVLVGPLGCDSDGPGVPELPTVSLPSVSVNGAGAGNIGKILFAESIGSCEIGGLTVPAIVYARVTWPQYDLTIYNILAPTSDNLNVLFLYSRADTMRSIWHESFSKPLDSSVARGSVKYNNAIAETRPALKRILTVPDSSQLVVGVELNGLGIQYADHVGTIDIAGNVHQLYPFELVDCSDCGSGIYSGWFELHAIIGRPGHDLGFGILYLPVEDHSTIRLSYYMRLDPVQYGPAATYDAEWTVSQNLARETATKRLSPLLEATAQ